MVEWLIKIQEFKKRTVLYNVGSDRPIELLDLAKKKLNYLKISVNFKRKIRIKKIDKYVPIIRKTKNDLKVKILYNLTKSLKKSLKFV